MVPDLVQHTLISARKFAGAEYISIYDVNEVNIYDGQTAKIQISEVGVLKFWWCPVARLWCIPLKVDITNLNTDTLLLNSLDGQKSISPLYCVPTSLTAVHHVQTRMAKHTPDVFREKT